MLRVTGALRRRSLRGLLLFLFLLLVLGGSVVGLCLTFYLTSVGAFASLTVLNFLIFMAAWLVPQWLITNWVNQY